MGPRPFRPKVELEGAIDRGELIWAIDLAKTLTEESGQPIDLALALRLLPLVVVQRPGEYDAWARRWLSRYLAEAAPTIAQAAQVTGALADLPVDSEMLGTISEVLT
jgi:hypothetical protein